MSFAADTSASVYQICASAGKAWNNGFITSVICRAQNGYHITTGYADNSAEA